MKNVKSVKVNFLQINHEVKKVMKSKGVEVLSIVDAWEKYGWIKKLIRKKPEEGYFIWVKKQVNFPISTGVYISEKGITQRLVNLTVIESGIKAKGFSLCSSIIDSNSTHIAKGIVVIKKNSSFELTSIHSWHSSDRVETEYKYVLEKGSRLSYLFKNMNPPQKAKYITRLVNKENSISKVRSVVNGIKTRVYLEDEVNIKGKNASSTIEIRVVGRKDSKIEGVTKAVAEAAGKAHLDCEGLLVDRKSEIKLVPMLEVKNKDAILTHEASIGKIADEQLYYLRSRGLSEKQAIDLIVSGFLRS